MATKTSTRVSAGTQPRVLRVGVVCDTAVYSLAASLSTGDVIQMIRVPQNGRVLDVYVKYASDGEGSFTVGDGVDTDRYISDTNVSAGATGQVLARLNTIIAPYTYSTDDTIDIVFSLSTVQPSTGAIYMVAMIEYPGVA
jgi:hypothetical protein